MSGSERESVLPRSILAIADYLMVPILKDVLIVIRESARESAREE